MRSEKLVRDADRACRTRIEAERPSEADCAADGDEDESWPKLVRKCVVGGIAFDEPLGCIRVARDPGGHYVEFPFDVEVGLEPPEV